MDNDLNEEEDSANQSICYGPPSDFDPFARSPETLRDEISDIVFDEPSEILERRRNMEKQIQLVNSKIEWKRNETEGNQTQAEYYKKQYEELLEIVRSIDEECVKSVESISDIQELEKLKVEYVSKQ